MEDQNKEPKKEEVLEMKFDPNTIKNLGLKRWVFI
jgi:hypothetical protein